jgi:hypothetical protein
MSTTTNMGLVLPTVGVTADSTGESQLLTAFETVDAHDHTTGKGVQVPSAGININGTLEFNGQALTEVNYMSMGTVSGTPAILSVYSNGTDFFYKNASGTAIQLTSGGAVNAVGTGIISYSLPSSFPHAVTTGNAQQILGAPTASAVTFNLPAATNTMAFMIKDITGSAATNNITVTPNGTDQIDNAGAGVSFTISENSALYGFVSDGTSKWYVF